MTASREDLGRGDLQYTAGRGGPSWPDAPREDGAGLSDRWSASGSEVYDEEVAPGPIIRKGRPRGPCGRRLFCRRKRPEDEMLHMASQKLRCPCGHSWECPDPGQIPADVREICP